MAKGTKKENLELAEEHIKIAEDLVSKESRKCDDDACEQKFAKTQLELEKAEAGVEEELDGSE